MCKNCDRPEVRAGITEVTEALGIADLASRVMIHRFSDTEPGNEKFVNPAAYGSPTLTVGNASVIKSGLMRELDSFLSESMQAVRMSTMMGVPLDAMVNTDEGRVLLTAVLDALDAVNVGAVTEVGEFTIPDDAAALVGEADGTTTTGE